MISEMSKSELEKIVANSKYDATGGATDDIDYFLRLKNGKKTMLMHASHTPDGYEVLYRGPWVNESHIFGKLADGFYQEALSGLLPTKTAQQRASFKKFWEDVVELYKNTSKAIKRLKIIAASGFVVVNLPLLSVILNVWEDMPYFYQGVGDLVVVGTQIGASALMLGYFVNQLKNFATDNIELIERNPSLAMFYERAKSRLGQY